LFFVCVVSAKILRLGRFWKKKNVIDIGRYLPKVPIKMKKTFLQESSMPPPSVDVCKTKIQIACELKNFSICNYY